MSRSRVTTAQCRWAGVLVPMSSVGAVACYWPGLVSVSVRSMTPHIATHSTHSACVGHRVCEVIGSEYGEDVAVAGGAERKKERSVRQDVTAPPPPAAE